MHAIVAKLSDAELVELYIDEDSQPAVRLTERAAQVGRALALASDDDGAGCAPGSGGGAQ